MGKEQSGSASLRAFRRKMANPVHWRRANQVVGKYTRQDVATVESATRVIDDLSTSFGIELTPSDKRKAAQWLVQQGIDPQRRKDRLLLWKKTK
ncbi:hypothetical protein [Alicyclobacillus sp. ALC3]|uniref:hypothetical protein n=1 Tax=Alicyclobacillus sp. ALC3 TaxID=2796143 RepID=UPI002379E317|nr:hypothetical protein [Alicyclobacillus sp. ALC3]WDL97539.1 hypothetical protein JC200_02070 [Alicyclobacillus sp. ALC3]